jgi:hypothetical protein
MPTARFEQGEKLIERSVEPVSFRVAGNLRQNRGADHLFRILELAKGFPRPLQQLVALCQSVSGPQRGPGRGRRLFDVRHVANRALASAGAEARAPCGCNNQ